MLYTFFGTDVVEVRRRAHVFLSEYENKGSEIVHVTPENYYAGILVDLAGSVSLFTGTQIVLLDTPSGKKDVFDDVVDQLDLLKESDTSFVLIEDALLAPLKKKLAKYAEKNEEILAEKKERFNAFTLTDALKNRDKKSLWILLVEAWRNNLSNEEIVGVLYWQLKMLRLAEKTSTAEEAGQKPFVYQKTKNALKKFKKGELSTLSRQLLALYHDGHLGKRDIDIALERWVLSL